MLAADYYVIHESLQANGVIFSFTGLVSENILQSLGEALKLRLALEKADPNVVKRLFSIFVEQVQNVIRYSAERLESGPGWRSDLSAGLIMVGQEQNHFFVVCGNAIAQADVAPLRERLQHLLTMDKEQLREYYRQQLKEPSGTGSKGGDIGLVEIARRSSAPLEFDFLRLSASQSFFCLKAYI